MSTEISEWVELNYHVQYNYMKNKGIFSLIGFTLFILGTLSLVLSLVSVQLSFLTWLEYFGRGFGLLFKLIMIMVGVVTDALVEDKLNLLFRMGPLAATNFNKAMYILGYHQER